MATKTIKEWLSELPEPYRTQALDNYDSNFYPYNTARFLSDALMYAFDWKLSPQGFEYWGLLFDIL